MPRELVLRVTIKDCVVQTFRCGGKGGQNKDKRDTGVRVIHQPSGARGESREERNQLENKRKAFRRMGESPLFRAWVNSRIAAVNEPARAEPVEPYVRTYTLDPQERVKDHATGIVTHDAQRVLDGELDQFKGA